MYHNQCTMNNVKLIDEVDLDIGKIVYNKNELFNKI